MAGRSFSGLAPREPVQNVTPFAGLSSRIEGGSFTVTLIGTEVVVIPALSVATAVIE